MRPYVEELQQLQEMNGAAGPLAALLDRIIERPRDHARLLNTLSRLEYVGVRKMLKSRRSEELDLDGLQHVLDETIHALRLKKAALAVAGGEQGVATFSASDTLAGDAGERYLQGVDRAAEDALADLPEATRAAANYLLSSAAIEVRAQAFYPLYEARLRAHGVAVSVAAIMRDEDRHLGEMQARLEGSLPGWRGRLERALAEEKRLFAGFVDALSAALTETTAALSETPDRSRLAAP
jgi:rubrerythrin